VYCTGYKKRHKKDKIVYFYKQIQECFFSRTLQAIIMATYAVHAVLTLVSLISLSRTSYSTCVNGMSSPVKFFIKARKNSEWFIMPFSAAIAVGRSRSSFTLSYTSFVITFSSPSFASNSYAVHTLTFQSKYWLNQMTSCSNDTLQHHKS